MIQTAEKKKSSSSLGAYPHGADHRVFQGHVIICCRYFTWGFSRYSSKPQDCLKSSLSLRERELLSISKLSLLFSAHLFFL